MINKSMKDTATELIQVFTLNIFSFSAITFTDIENGMKVIMFLITAGFTLDKWIQHRKKSKGRK